MSSIQKKITGRASFHPTLIYCMVFVCLTKCKANEITDHVITDHVRGFAFDVSREDTPSVKY